MTENGNHGGSSYEETDSLALFVGLKNDLSDYAASSCNSIYQVIKVYNFYPFALCQKLFVVHWCKLNLHLA
jgi:ethanolaminephosphotransferase